MNTIVIYHSILLLLQDCCMIKNKGGKNIYNVQFYCFYVIIITCIYI